MTLNLAAYLFTPIDEPDMLVERVRARSEELALRGTVLIAPEGINCFLAGEDASVRAWLAWLRSDPRFEAIEAKLSHSETLPFARLKVKRKREIIAFRRSGATPLDGRAATVSPAALSQWLARGSDDGGRRVVLLDTRNREEVLHGTFHGAVTLPIDNFVDFPEAVEQVREALADATVVSFCTGGIRCEKAARWMQDAGFENVLQLDGGILNYFDKVGGDHYDGNCFVFDARVALDARLRPAEDAGQPD